MLINEVCKECGITKKAIEYYEKHKLIKPKLNDNSYRYFDDTDVMLLKEIAVLRRLNIGISDINAIIRSDDKTSALKEYGLKKELQIEQMKIQYECLNYLISTNYNIDEAIDTINYKLDENMVIKDKLLQAFPGKYGIYLCVHFGKFLNGKVDSDEKAIAYHRVVKFLDSIDGTCFSEELKQYLSEALDRLSESDLQKMDQSVTESIEDINGFLEDKKDFLAHYLEYVNSEEFKSSPAYKIKQLLREFQKSSGYNDIFIPNLKILSDSYREYMEKLKAANKTFLEVYPEAQNLTI